MAKYTLWVKMSQVERENYIASISRHLQHMWQCNQAWMQIDNTGMHGFTAETVTPLITFLSLHYALLFAIIESLEDHQVPILQKVNEVLGDKGEVLEGFRHALFHLPPDVNDERSSDLLFKGAILEASQAEDCIKDWMKEQYDLHDQSESVTT